MDHRTHTRLSDAELTDANLVGAPIYGPADEKVGAISQLDQSGQVPRAVVDVGGFLGIGAKPVLIDLAQLNLMRHDDGSVHGTVSWTKDELKALPEHRG